MHKTLPVFLTLLVLTSPFTWADSARATSLLEQATARVDRFVDHYRRTFDQQALAYELTAAAQELQESASLAGQSKNPALAAQALTKLGDVYRYQNQWDTSIQTYQQATKTAASAKASEAEVRALLGHARALIYGKKAIGAARPFIEQAVDRVAALEDPSLQFDTLDLLSQLQLEEGNIAGAADSINRAFRLQDRLADEKLLFYGYFDRAGIYQELAQKGLDETPRRSHLQALELARRDYKVAKEKATQLGWTGLANQMQGFLDRLALTEQMIRQQQSFRETLANAQIFSPATPKDVVLSESYTAGASPESAQLISLIEALGGLPLEEDARGAYLRGLLDEMAGKSDAALKWYLQATDLLEADRRKLFDERSRASFLDDKVSLYYTAITHLLERKRYAEAFELMERSRGRVMSDLLATKQVSLGSEADNELYAKLLALDAQIAEYQSVLFDSELANSDAPDAEPHPNQTALREELAKLIEERADVQKRISKASASLANLVSSEPASLGAVQKILRQDDSELLTYLCLDSQLLIWHIRPGSVEVRSVFLPRSELSAKVAKLRLSMTDPRNQFATQTAHELYLYLISPFADKIRSKRLVIVPHEDLYYLPFQALSTDGETQFLIDKFAISYAPSATVLTRMQPPKPLALGQALAIADPSLANAPREVQAISNFHEGRFSFDHLATEAEVRAWIPDKDLVHFAVHGSFHAEQPLLSCLHLKADSADDGRLTAAEMYGLPLQDTQLVVLSACETGIVKATQANEILGITRGLLFAGADALVLSAWKIDDEGTADWMEVFYQELRTQPAPDAARKAIQSLRQEPSYAHPFFWSPYLITAR